MVGPGSLALSLEWTGKAKNLSFGGPAHQSEPCWEKVKVREEGKRKADLEAMGGPWRRSVNNV